jgi:hypothetical protein
MPSTPPNVISKLRLKLARGKIVTVDREEANLQVLTLASEEAQAVANPVNRPMEYLSALYEALNRYRVLHLESLSRGR